MGRKNAKGTVSIVQDGQRIRLRWRYQRKRYSLNLFEYNKANLAQVRKVVLQIEQDLLEGTFDVTLTGYKPAGDAPNEILFPFSISEQFVRFRTFF